MKVDVSEVKAFRSCERQWLLSSRNRFHLRSLVPPPAFAMGTLFHESLAQLYLGVSLDKVMEMVRREMQTDTDAALLAMIPGYAKNVLPGDLDRFQVLDIEHHFEVAPKTHDGKYLFPLEPKCDPKTGEVEYDANGKVVMVSSVLICGSMDMIVYDPDQNKIYIFEHKTCKNFRDDTYLWMDEQPRVYTWAGREYVEEFNKKRLDAWHADCIKYETETHPGETYPVPRPEPATLGGVYMNEVKKLLRQFSYKRTLCTYSTEDLDNFMMAFFGTCKHIKHMVDNDSYAAPQPGFMSCRGCMFNTICSTYMYENLNRDEIVEEFQEEFVVRTEDHLEEKTERSTEV